MPTKDVVFPQKGAKPIGPYSPGIRYGNLLFTSGQIGLDPNSGKLVEGDIATEARQALENLSAIIAAAGTSLDKVLKTTLFLTDIATFTAVNEVYASYFRENPPSRSTIQVTALPGGARVEIESIAALE
ncbi:MAG: RidA family protein [Anaerolineales bacterium]